MNTFIFVFSIFAILFGVKAMQFSTREAELIAAGEPLPKERLFLGVRILGDGSSRLMYPLGLLITAASSLSLGASIFTAIARLL